MYECFELTKPISYVNILFPSIANLKCTPSDRKGILRVHHTCISVWEPLV